MKDTKKVLKALSDTKIKEFEGLVNADLEWINLFHANITASFKRSHFFYFMACWLLLLLFFSFFFPFFFLFLSFFFSFSLFFFFFLFRSFSSDPESACG